MSDESLQVYLTTTDANHYPDEANRFMKMAAALLDRYEAEIKASGDITLAYMTGYERGKSDLQNLLRENREAKLAELKEKIREETANSKPWI